MKTKYKKLKITLISVASFLIIITVASLIYLSDYYRAEDVALEVITNSDYMEVDDNLSILLPTNGTVDTALIFYPGAKVEHTAYLPILNKLRNEGIACVLVKMPFNMAFFNVNAANSVYEKMPYIKKWYIGGHSLGGAMASSYASSNPTKVDGLILLGSYIYGDYLPQDTLTVYGTLNDQNVDYTENVVEIEGGNHAQFGNYGKQKGDKDATITTQEQQEITVDAIMNFINSR